jgi:hypothetical protein
MKKVLFSQALLLAALIPVTIALAQPTATHTEQPAAATAPVEVIKAVSKPVAQVEKIIEEPAIVKEPTIAKEQAPEPVVVVSPPAPDSTYEELLASYGYKEAFGSDAHSYMIYQFTYKLSKQYPERFTVDSIGASIKRINSVFTPLPDIEWTSAYLNFTW